MTVAVVVHACVQPCITPKSQRGASPFRKALQWPLQVHGRPALSQHPRLRVPPHVRDLIFRPRCGQHETTAVQPLVRVCKPITWLRVKAGNGRGKPAVLHYIPRIT